MRSVTSPASRCSRTVRWRRARWWRRSSPAASAPGTSAAIPAVCFTDPEIVTAGLSPDEARAQGYEVRIGQFPFNANGRAMTTEAEDGFVRAVARADTNLVLGLQAVGAGVSELSSAFSLALEIGARLEDIAGTIHAHPTRSEGWRKPH